MIDWPFAVEGEERFKVKLRVLGSNEAEAAYLATVDYFKSKKLKLDATDAVFALRERAEIVFRAYSADGEALAGDVEELVKQPLAILEDLYATYRQFQSDVCAVPHSSKDMEALVEHLKKNGSAEALSALPSSWLTALITFMASQLPPSTTANELG